MTLDQIIFLAITTGAIVLFMTNWLRVDLVGLLIILSLSMTRLINGEDALSGFSSEPAIIVGAVFVLSAGLANTGATDMIGRLITRLSGSSETLATLVVMTGVAILSSVTHHLMVTAMMLPIVMDLCRKKNFSASRMLIPMATAASLGTTLTLIGAPAFLLANQIIARSGAKPLGLFSVSQVGLPIVAASFILIILLKWMLPKNSGSLNNEEMFKHSRISTEIVVPDESQWIGRTLGQLKEETVERFKIVSLYRDDEAVSRRNDEEVLRAGDVMLIETNSDELVSVDEKLGLALRALKKYGEQSGNADATHLDSEKNEILEAIIGPNSRFIGKTLSQIGFFHRFGVVVVALWRKKGWMSAKISQTVLKEGDLIVLWGPAEKFQSLSGSRDFLLFVPFQGQTKKRFLMPLSFLIMGVSIVIASMGWLQAHIAFMAGALAMVLTGCVSVEKAYSAIETKVFIMIAGVIPLGLAMQKVGFDRLVADSLSGFVQGLGPFWILMMFFWFAALLTQILSDAATTILIVPIGLAMAATSGFSSIAVVVTITIGAIASFLTPIGHHGNLLILGPGGYRFSDFLKIGFPLTAMISVITCVLTMQVWK